MRICQVSGEASKVEISWEDAEAAKGQHAGGGCL